MKSFVVILTYIFITQILSVRSNVIPIADGDRNRNLTCDCGRKHRLDSRIVDGERANIKEYPWTAALTVSGNIFCGGALISDQYILTAAHCFKIIAFRTLAKVRLGITSRDEPTEDRNIADIISHENYRSNRSGFFDIALIKLLEKVIFRSNIYALCLPNPSDDYTYQVAIIAGWGAVNHDGHASNDLQSAMVKVIPMKKCQRMFEKVDKVVNENNICAGGQNESDACQGDSGSPMFLEQNGIYKVIGIVSWGIGCASKYPGVYTNVNYYLPWIKKHSELICTVSE